MIIKKTSPGLDPGADLAAALGAGTVVEEYDDAQPLTRQVAEAEVFLIRSTPITREVIDAAPRLRLIQRPGTHIEAVDMAHASAKGIPVCNIPAELTGVGPYVAEAALFLMLAVAKRYKESLRSIHERKAGVPLAHGLRGKTLGLIGAGRTGAPLIRAAQGLGMRAIAVKRQVSPAIERDLGLDWLGPITELESMLRQSDVVSIHLPLNAQTRGFVGSREIGWMKDGAILVNIARAAIVDYDALFDALAGGKLAGAGLDVWWQEPADPDDKLLRLDTVVLTPHNAGITVDAREQMTRIVTDNIRRVRDGGKPLYRVNL